MYVTINAEVSESGIAHWMLQTRVRLRRRSDWRTTPLGLILPPMPLVLPSVGALLLVAGVVGPVAAQTASLEPTRPAADSLLAQRLAAVPAELRLAGGDLHVINLYKLQSEVLLGSAGEPADTVIVRLVRSVYEPYTGFWQGYLGDEAAFREWAAELLAPDHPIHSRVVPLLDAELDRRFDDGVAWIDSTTGRRPAGTWYIVFGPGWTDMGGLTGIGMVADFSRMEPDSAAIAGILPHELTHQVQGATAAHAADPDAGTVLDRVVGEGFATYVAGVYAAGERTDAENLGYSSAEWEWALAHEAGLVAALRPILSSRDRDDIDLVAARNAQLIEGAPGAAGYFIGLRIVQAYVDRHGDESWKELYDMPVRDVLAKSGYLDER